MTSFVKYLLGPRRAPTESFVSRFDDINIPDDLEIELGGDPLPDPRRSSPEVPILPRKEFQDETIPKTPLPPFSIEESHEEEKTSDSLCDIAINSPVAPAITPAELYFKGSPAISLRRSFAGFSNTPERARRVETEDLEGKEAIEDTGDDVIFSRVRHNRFEYVKRALEEGMSPRVVDDRGNTLLHICSQNNLRKMATMVIRAGCPLSQRNKKGFTPLDYCVKYSFYDMGDWLTSLGAVRGEFKGDVPNRALRRNSIR